MLMKTTRLFAAAALAALLAPIAPWAGEGHGHDHGHAGKESHGHGEKAKGTGRTDIREISAALHENLACLDSELPAADHAKFHGCLEAMGALGQDLIALKAPADPVRKKRVNGYAKNLDRMARKVDEYKDAKKMDKAREQLKKLNDQVALIEDQFDELAKKSAPSP